MTDYTSNITPEELDDFRENGYSDQDALDLAQGLLEQAIPCLGDIADSLKDWQKTLVKSAILEMAYYLQLEKQNFEGATSPFQSETQGSYSYSKMSVAVRNKTGTGVANFDRAVDTLASMCDITDDSNGMFAVSSEQVFKSGFDSYRRDRQLRNHRRYPRWYSGGVF